MGLLVKRGNESYSAFKRPVLFSHSIMSGMQRLTVPGKHKRRSERRKLKPKKPKKFHTKLTEGKPKSKNHKLGRGQMGVNHPEIEIKKNKRPSMVFSSVIL